jgi:hypothetical protein
MKRKRRTPEQIIRKLREAERLKAEGQTIAQVVQQVDISEQTHASVNLRPAHDHRGSASPAHGAPATATAPSPAICAGMVRPITPRLHAISGSS